MEECEGEGGGCCSNINNSLGDGDSVIRRAKFVGTFSVDVDVLQRKSESIQDNLSILRAGYNHGQEVLLSISLQRVTVTSLTKSKVMMSHPLKRISYATCDPASCLFSFMARQDGSEVNIQQCHTFRLTTPHQAEELNTVLGTAFRMAYAATLTAQKGPAGRRLQSAVSRGGMSASRSVEDLLSASSRLRVSKSTVTLGELSSKVTSQVTGSQVTPEVTTCAEYSEVWDPGDSGISSTSDSTVSYSAQTGALQLEDLSQVPWYEAEMPRDLAMTVLANEPLGSFMVRKSESQPGTLALSVRVPKTFHPLGITHYIIVKLQAGYQIKGFLKVHGSLTALITHHSIMPELLPVTLNIHRHNPSFSDAEPDYASLQDFTQLMKDMKLSGQKSQYDHLEEDAYQ